jgi:hypothetical protein
MKSHLVVFQKHDFGDELQIVRTDNERLGTHNFPATKEGWGKLSDWLDNQDIAGFSVTFEVHEWLVENGL